MIIAGIQKFSDGEQFAILMVDRRLLISWPDNDPLCGSVLTLLLEADTDRHFEWKEPAVWLNDESFVEARAYIDKLYRNKSTQNGRILEA